MVWYIEHVYNLDIQNADHGIAILGLGLCPCTVIKKHWLSCGRRCNCGHLGGYAPAHLNAKLRHWRA